MTGMQNWAGNYTYSTDRLFEPGSVEELIEIVKKEAKIKVLGTRHCFNSIADSKDCFLSLSALNRIGPLDTQRQTVTVEAGVRYGELAVWLNSRGYALHNLASLPHISVAGGCLTATHGSGIRNGNLATAVRAMELVTAEGALLTLSEEKDPDIFPGAVVNLGAIGVLTQLTLSVQPTFQVRQTVYERLGMQQLEQHFGDIMSAGYSVSLFTDWKDQTIGEVWIKSRVEEAPLPAVFFGAAAAGSDLHPIKEMPAENCTEQRGIPGDWHERLPHFRMGFTPSSGKELQSEYFVPRERSYEALQALAGIQEKISPHLLISEVRSVAADGLWMSPCYQQDSTAFHFTWQPDWPAVRSLLPLVEERMAPFGARPHWGKLFVTSPAQLGSLYGKLPDFLQLLGQMDPEGKFRNEFLDSWLFGG